MSDAHDPPPPSSQSNKYKLLLITSTELGVAGGSIYFATHFTPCEKMIVCCLEQHSKQGCGRLGMEKPEEVSVHKLRNDLPIFHGIINQHRGMTGEVPKSDIR